MSSSIKVENSSNVTIGSLATDGSKIGIYTLCAGCGKQTMTETGPMLLNVQIGGPGRTCVCGSKDGIVEISRTPPSWWKPE